MPEVIKHPYQRLVDTINAGECVLHDGEFITRVEDLPKEDDYTDDTERKHRIAADLDTEIAALEARKKALLQSSPSAETHKEKQKTSPSPYGVHEVADADKNLDADTGSAADMTWPQLRRKAIDAGMPDAAKSTKSEIEAWFVEHSEDA